MNTKKLVVAIAILAVLLSGLSNPITVRADLSKVDQRVLDQVDAEGSAEYHVIMAFQADVSGAEKLGTKDEKTIYVYDLLTRTAAETQAPILAQLDAEGVKYESYYIYNMIIVTSGRATVEWLASRPDVARIVPLPDARTEPVSKDILSTGEHTVALPGQFSTEGNSRVETIELNLVRVKANLAWNMGFRGEGMVVASNDTGVSYTHPALVNQYRGNLGGGNYNHNYNWWGGAGSPAPTDGDGHGTHTTGTMVGDDGGANQIGVAPGAKWIACAGLGGSTPIECFQFFLAPWDLNHANADPTRAPDAINNSWYDPSGYDYRPIIQNLNAAGVAVIKSAGNNGPGCSSISNPGGVPEIIATAAFDHRNDIIASFSSRGPSSQYGETILKPEVAAPGVNVRSSVPGGGYDGTYSGTSMAAPHSTGMVALIWSAASCIQGNVPLTKQIMMETAEAKIDAQCAPFVDHPNDVWGWGVLDAQNAVQTAMSYCGGSGTLQGTVTDASTTLPIENALVDARNSSNFGRSELTDPTGYYTMTLFNDVYTVTASAYGYNSGLAAGVPVITDTTTVQDFALVPLPVYTVSGHVYDSVTNEPLEATLEFTDAPVPPVNSSPSGFYTIQVAQGTWTLQASADAHMPQTQVVEVNSDLTVDFYLDPLPCILLVDDDNNAPNTASYYTAALDSMGLEYNVFDTAGGAGPALENLMGYNMVMWFSGDAYGGSAGPGGSDEANLSAYLDAGGSLFLDSQDYLYDFGLTPFGQNYLGIASFTSDTGDANSIIGITGDPIGNGLGPFPLTYPANFSDYGDRLTAGSGSIAFKANNNTNNLDIDKDGGAWKTVFFGTSWVPLYNNNSANGVTVMGRIVDFMGGCTAPVDVDIDPLEQEKIGQPGETVVYTYTVTNDSNVLQEVMLSVDAQWPTEAPTTAGELAAGASATVVVTVTIPTMPAVIIASDTFTLTATGSVGGSGVATGTTLANVNPQVNLVAPADDSGMPLEVVTYDFVVTNTGDYTDSFSLDVTGVWFASLPGGANTGPLAAGESITVTVEVTVPGNVSNGDTDVTTLTATSVLDAAVSASADVITTAIVWYYNLMPLVNR